MPRFVLLAHDHPHPHFDLMLDIGESLRTWRLSTMPVAGATLLAVPLGDHRREYLDYEGHVSGDRGNVRRVDEGEYRLIEDAHGRVILELQGQQVAGVITLQAPVM